jgi:hypothetical protein
MKIIITASGAEGEYRLQSTDDGLYTQPGVVHKSRVAAYKDARLLWPANSPWQGRKVRGGWEIEID